MIGYGLDFGFSNDPTACIAVYRWNGKLILDEVIYRKGLANSEIAKLLKDDGVKPNDEIYADSAEPKSISEIKAYGLNRMQAVKKGPDSILAGIQILQEFEMLVTKRSINLKKELESYSWRKDKDGQTLNEPEDINNHAIDGTRYLALMKLGKRPKPSFKIYSTSL